MPKLYKSIFVFAFALNLGGLFFMATPLAARAAAVNVPVDFQPQVSIPGSVFSNTAPVTGGVYDPVTRTTSSDLLAKYIQAIYNYGLAIGGILAAIVLMAGGVLWLVSAGNDSKITQAKELILGSIIGILILFGSWIILNTINPDLLKLKVISPMSISQETLQGIVCCDPANGGTRFDVTTKDGKKYYNSGDKKGQEWPGCTQAMNFKKVTECPDANYSCVSSPQSLIGADSFKCVNNDDVCCSCQTGLFGSITNSFCQNHTKMSNCDSICATKGNGSYTTYIFPGTYNCGPALLGAVAICSPPGGWSIK